MSRTGISASTTSLRLLELKHKFCDEDKPKKKQNKEPCEKIGIFKLNFDCLIHIISFLGLKDLANLDKVSDHFQPITEHSYKKYKSFDCKSIRPITFYDGRIALNQIGSYLTSIKIDQNDLSTNSHDFLELVLIVCPNLEHIRIDDITLDSKMLKKMKNLFPKLKSIELISCSLDDSIGHYLASAKFLEKLNLRKNEAINGSCISNFKNLVSLNLSRCNNFLPIHFTNLCINNTNLVELNILRCQLTPSAVINIVKYLLNIEELSISSNYEYLSSNDFLPFTNLSKLKKLKVKFIESATGANTDDLIVKLSEKDSLQSLDISQNPITEKLIEALVRFTKLEILKISDSSYAYSFNDNVLSQLQMKKNIKELYLVRRSTVTTAGLTSFVEDSPNIRVLDVGWNFNITDDIYYSILASLKEQDRQHSLSLFVHNTYRRENLLKIDPEMMVKNLSWIKFTFISDDNEAIDEDADSVQSNVQVSSVEDDSENRDWNNSDDGW